MPRAGDTGQLPFKVCQKVWCALPVGLPEGRVLGPSAGRVRPAAQGTAMWQENRTSPTAVRRLCLKSEAGSGRTSRAKGGNLAGKSPLGARVRGWYAEVPVSRPQ